MSENTEFNLNDLLDQQQEAAIDTSMLRPDDGEYEATIVKFGELKVITAKQGKNVGKDYTLLEIYYELNSWNPPEGEQRPLIKSAIFVDIGPDGRLDFSDPRKNQALGKIKEACGCNKPGSTLADILNSSLIVQVKNETKGENTNTRVTKWAARGN